MALLKVHNKSLTCLCSLFQRHRVIFLEHACIVLKSSFVFVCIIIFCCFIHATTVRSPDYASINTRTS